MKKLFLILAASLSAASLVHAQANLPDKNVVIEIKTAELPPDWKTNDSLPSLTDPSGANTPVRLTVGRKAGTTYQCLHFRDGQSEEVWRLDSWLGWKNRDGELTLLKDDSSMEDGPSKVFFPKKGLPGLPWVRADNLIETKGGNSSFRYHAQELKTDDNSTVLRAWIDASSQQPVMAQQGRLTFVYKFGEVVSIPELPATLAERYQEIKKGDAFLKEMRARRNP